MIRVSEHAGSSVWRGCLGMALGRFVRFAYARCVHGYCVRFRALLVANGAIRHPRCTPDALEVTQNNDTTTPQPMHAQHSTHNTARSTHTMTTTCCLVVAVFVLLVVVVVVLAAICVGESRCVGRTVLRLKSEVVCRVLSHLLVCIDNDRRKLLVFFFVLRTKCAKGKGN